VLEVVIDTQSVDEAALERGREALMRGWSTTEQAEAPLLLTRAQGCHVWDSEGREYLDCTSQAWSNNVGAGHPRVLAAAQAQAAQITHARANYDTVPLLLLSDRLVRLAPGGLTKVAYSLHGSTAVEMAVKLAAKNRPGAGPLMTLCDGYHGRTLIGMAASWPHTHTQFQGLQPAVVRVPQPNPYRPPAGVTSSDLAVYHAELLQDAIRRGVNGTPLAFLMEPIQGNGGHIEFPREYYRLVRQVCDEEGVLLIWDEIQTGFGRVGEWWAADHYEVTPDILIFGKAIAGGFPLAGVLARDELVGFETADESLTFAQWPVSMAAALATLDVIEDEGLLEGARTAGEYVTGRLLELQGRHRLIGDVRGPGLFTAIELVRDRGTKEPAAAETEAVYDLALKRGVMFGTSKYAGLGNVVKFKPPLTITREDVDRAIDVLDTVLATIEEG
jgi:4-aminobutyrate aminotransferase/4-aminobutyrate aminotransferase/(S)-3-amino-2-methylpropionate transaminase